jgi:hypothetical protein
MNKADPKGQCEGAKYATEVEPANISASQQHRSFLKSGYCPLICDRFDVLPESSPQ